MTLGFNYYCSSEVNANGIKTKAVRKKMIAVRSLIIGLVSHL